MSVEIRPIQPDEYPAWIALTNSAFFFEGAAEAQAKFSRRYTDLSRVVGAFDGGRLVGTSRSFATALSTPGGRMLPATALTGAAVMPTHRRQGLLTAMCRAELEAAAARGDPLALLIASEYPTYGRFGFGPATWHATYTVDRRAVHFAQPTAGQLELAAPADLREAAIRLYERFRLECPGAIARDAFWWDLNLALITPPAGPRWKGRMVLYRGQDGQPAGYVRYHVEPGWDERQPKSTLVIDELLAATPAAYARLWKYCCEVDLIASVRASDRSVDELLPWLLTDARAVRQVYRADFLWVRILNVIATLAGRGYSSEGRLVVEVVDELGFAAGRFLLEAGQDGADCRRSQADADIVMPVQALGTALLGGASPRLLKDGGWLEERRTGALGKAEAMFRSPVTPWCSTWF